MEKKQRTEIATPGQFGRIDLLTGEAAATGDDFSWITPRRTADGSFTALIWPQPTAPYRDGEEA